MSVAHEQMAGGTDGWVVIAARDSKIVPALLDTGMGVNAYEDLASLREAVSDGFPVPEVVLVDAQNLPVGDSGAPTGHAEMELTVEDGVAGHDLPRRAREVVCAALSALHAWLADDRFAGSRLVFVTRGVAGDGRGGVDGLVGAGVWGLLRSAESENAGRFGLVDVDGQASSFGALSRALSTGESQLAVRDGEVSVPRLARVGSDDALVAPDGVSEWCLEGGGGTLEGLALVESAGEPLGADELRIGVRAAGLNFRDVLIALGMYPDEAFLGSEGAGVVLEVGSGVHEFEVGDRVMGSLARGFGPVAVADRRRVVRIPDGWSFVQAASVPVAFLTAYYALVDLAGVRSGQRVLVHAAAGGVGMAAVQIARHLGAEVFGTASQGKWETLRRLGLDESHIASSRTLEFKDRFLEQTDGCGVDVVLDSLAGEFVDASLELLAEGGRFIEMGRTDMRDAAQVAGDRPGVAYTAFSMEEVPPDRIGEMLCEIVDLFQRGALTPLPVVSWDVRRAREAFRFMSQARHIGKIVLTLPARADSESTVLITGGTGTLGALLARHLVTAYGIQSLVLTSRRGIEAPGAAELKDELGSLGARVEIVACDVSDREAVRKLLQDLPTEPPLRGVVHAAGALDDGVIESLGAEQVERVFAPKVDAAWHLHELTQDLSLSSFVLFSSAAGSLGSAGQGNYAAASSFLDALATYRRARGLAGTSIAWGYWEQASELTSGLGEADMARMGRQGMLPIPSKEGLELFDLASGSHQPALVGMRLDIAAVQARAREGLLPAPMGGLVRVSTRRTLDTGSLARRLTGVAPTERGGVVLELVRSEVAIVLGHASHGAIDPERAFKDLGFDSLSAIELRNRLGATTGLRLPATLVFDHPNSSVLARHLLELVAGTGEARPASAETEVRELLTSIPLVRLRESGLLGSLLALANPGAVSPAAGAGATADMIDEMDVEGLVNAAMSQSAGSL
jgi:polyketide synthase 12